jgi:hypothetical protein
MADRRPRSSYESDWLPYTKVTGRSAVRAAIGEALRSRSEVPQHLPHELLALLVQVNVASKSSDRSRRS